jgi:tungstate transport system substrate-binding protein
MGSIMWFRAGCLLFLCAMGFSAQAQERSITLASTTSTEQSGFFAHVLPLFEAATAIRVRVVAVGTGQALRLGQGGDADALLVHDPAAEEKFVAQGHGIDRRPVMFNDFVIVGPKSDPARINGLKSAGEALRRIAAAKAAFVSRGDDSGTHRMELRLWTAAKIDPAGSWYRQTGQGMGPSLNMAGELNAYILSDRATWANFKGRRDLVILLEGDPSLLNPYSSILINPAKHPGSNWAEAKIWHRWITSQPGKSAIESFRIERQQVFFVLREKPEG